MNAELSSRIARSEQIEAAYRDMQARGETDMIEVNKAHLAYLSQKNALARNMVDASRFCLSFRALTAESRLRSMLL